MKINTVLLLLILISFSSFGQKKIIDHTVYNDWKKIPESVISNDGKFVAWTVKPHRGDGFLYLKNIETGKLDSLKRGVEAQFSFESNFLICKITPTFDTLRKMELAKKPKDKWLKDTLVIWNLSKDSLIKIPNLKEYKLSQEAETIAYLQHSNDWPKMYLSKKEIKAEAKAEKKALRKKIPSLKTDGKLLTIQSMAGNKKKCFKNSTAFEISKNGQHLSFLTQKKGKKDSLKLNVWHVEKSELFSDNKSTIDISSLTFDYKSSRLVGLYSNDTLEQKYYTLFSYNLLNKQKEILIDSSTHFETNRVLSGNGRLRFIHKDEALVFGVWDKPEPFIKDTLLEIEKPKFDLWHWKEDRLQPQQVLELKRDATKTNAYIYRFADKKTTVIGRDSLFVSIPNNTENNYFLAFSDDAYKYQTWESPSPSNLYRIDAKTGEMVLLRSKTYFDAELTPKGDQFIYFNERENQYFIHSIENPSDKCITCAVKTNLFADMNGVAERPSPLGIIGFADKGNSLLIQSENDILVYSLQSGKTKSIISKLQKNATDTNYRYKIQHLATDSIYISAENSLLIQFNRITKSEIVFQLSGTFEELTFQEQINSAHHYLSFKKAKKGSNYLFLRSSNQDFPDLYVQKGTISERLSNANPQQKEYNWSTVEMISWKSYQGIELSGLLYKPENFDPNKSYPLMVYFYEMYSDEIHNHYAPKPTASIIYPTEYASAGYCVLIPDIRYQLGHPANSAYDCIMSGTDEVLKRYSNIDPKRLGLQGQSWGGYQTAQLITMTTRYKAAMAGAPVSNMFSAYGGIRWGSGLVRQFQYEKQQSRIGKTIWEAPELYRENSPLFHLPKVQTPLLIMSNDQDDAVPWYQGIELYTGLYRLQKPVWLLNYNGDAHNLMKNANRFDLSIRMRQFFDYYLLNAAIPIWLEEGIPALEKGKELKYELKSE